MTAATSLLEAIEQRDDAVLNNCIEHDGISEETFTHAEAVALWNSGWQQWLMDDKADNTHCQAAEAECESREFPASTPNSQLWHITLGMFLHQLHAAFPELPGAPAWAEVGDVEEE
jgi:hypothetical protein